MNNFFPVEISEIKLGKIIFKTTYSWAFCLRAPYESKSRYYSLVANSLNREKLKKILPDYDFSNVVSSENSIDENYSHQLRDYQKKDVNFLSQQSQVAIFSEMRTGKTPIALVTFSKWNLPRSLLIIVPSILQQQWQKSVAEWLKKPAYIITYLEKEWRYKFYQKLLQEKDWIIIVSKDTFKIDSSYFQKLKKRKGSNNDYCVIVDEAHFLRNHRSQQSKSIYVLNEAKYKMALTGTPIVNHHIDIFGILKFLQPKFYSSYWKFAEQYFYIQKLKFQKGRKIFEVRRVLNFKNEKTRQELQKILSQISVNRKQRDVLPWLPPVIYQKEYLPLEEQQQIIYSQQIEKWRNKYQPLDILAKLKTLTLYPPALDFNCLGSKFNYLISFLKEKKEKNLIIFSTRSETFLEPLYQTLKKEKIEVGIITGQITYQEREKFIQSFQEGKISVLLCNIQSAGVGLNLSQAETIIFADRSYSPADNEQAEARFLPTTSSENPRIRLVIDLVCLGTIDEKILKLLKRKEDIIKVLNNNPGYFFD